MDLLANDLSIHQQFHSFASFHEALSRLMTMRSIAQRHGRELHCNRGFRNADPVPGMSMEKAIARLSIDKQRAVSSWLSRDGPFWDDVREHDGGDYLECNGDVVTDTAVGEAAFRSLHGVGCGLVSLSPSGWELSPVKAIWRRQAEGLEDQSAMLKNWWDAEALNRDLEDIAPSIISWEELRNTAVNRFENLIFSKDCFSPLAGFTPARSSLDRFIFLLGVLDQLAGAHDANGRRTAAGNRTYKKYFTGAKALFSDSSESEKNSFRQRLTFKNPDKPGHSLFCPWHGKLSHQIFRLHFSWPIVANRPVYVVYAGPKRTKR